MHKKATLAKGASNIGAFFIISATTTPTALLSSMVLRFMTQMLCNMRDILDELFASRQEIQKAGEDTAKSASEKRVPVCQNTGKANLINMFRIVLFALSVPGSNAFVERIFSVITIKWSDSRNAAWS